ncbi:preprotein translocase subunit SecA [Candidatus Peregrinibacteria bacterium]|nr:preprotein translocase subunit SecA [Candidatus Peregrinibacteria bacterium]
MITKVLNKIIGDKNKKTLKRITPFVEKINKIEEKFQTEITDQNAVLAKTSELRDHLKNGKTLEDILPEAFALVKTACRHLKGTSWPVRGKDVEWNMIPYDVQLIGGVVMHRGNIAEMKTGEGKTLVCTMPVYLNALTGKGVFVVTVNDYLAQRDAEWMGGLYNYLGLSVGTIKHGQSPEEKKEAYSCDITYGTNNEFGFDYLRDNMTTNKEDIVQKNLHYAIVDEVDSILIDEARTPLIISAPAQESTAKYNQYARLIPQLQENVHYDIDEKSKTAALSEDGIAKMEQLLGMDNIYTEAGFTEVHHIEQALRAYACYQSDKDYIIKDDQIIIIDEFTGRLMPGRRYSHGLHQAIEAKERVEIKRESRTLATISFQNYFRMFDKLAGMTGTAETEAEEFYQIYGLDTVIIPTNRPVVRADKPDVIYKTQKGKYMSAVKKIKELHKKGQPVLVGTISVEKSEMLNKLLKLEGVPHNVLNAKHHESEAEIVANAGQKGAVTIATNMAGRGTDIKLEKGVKELGGLFVLGTERHESRRIDNQLRGRSGRQGDPGASQFFVSLEDELMRLFGGERVKGMMNMLKVPEDMPIETRMISRSIEGAQKKVEGRNFDIRKHLVEYDDVMNVHRDIIYKLRRKFLLSEDARAEIITMIEEVAESLVRNHTEARLPKNWDLEEIYEALNTIHKDTKEEITLEKLKAFSSQDELIQKAKDYLISNYKDKEQSLPDAKILRSIEKAVFLRANDTLWMEHIDAMSRLRENVAFTGYAQKNPLIEYKSQGFEMFNELLSLIKGNTVNTLFKIDIEKAVPASMMRRQELSNVRTNEDQVSAPLSGQRSSNPAVITPPPKQSKTYTSAASQTTATNQTKTNSDGSIISEKIGRNDPCPCGSGKKYKKCCG